MSRACYLLVRTVRTRQSSDSLECFWVYSIAVNTGRSAQQSNSVLKDGRNILLRFSRRTKPTTWFDHLGGLLSFCRSGSEWSLILRVPHVKLVAIFIAPKPAANALGPSPSRFGRGYNLHERTIGLRASCV
ncbi:hypothetical protein FRC08_017063 [Ceratobasidium sp. 394]|nr:hypothetical protein FRC08_017063 [Ceratobasidium sp. 394]